jgi:hypothetical protein
MTTLMRQGRAVSPTTLLAEPQSHSPRMRANEREDERSQDFKKRNYYSTRD